MIDWRLLMATGDCVLGDVAVVVAVVGIMKTGGFVGVRNGSKSIPVAYSAVRFTFISWPQDSSSSALVIFLIHLPGIGECSHSCFDLSHTFSS